jgi:uncharacterized pyridoxal phosphate-containing UPF0001 family protein
MLAEACGHRPEVLLEVNVSGESSKDGLAPDAVPEVIEYALGCRSLTLTGLMTMAPFLCPDPEDTLPCSHGCARAATAGRRSSASDSLICRWA